MARELIILPRFKRDYQIARKHPEFDAETLEYVFDVLISGEKLPEGLREHRLDKRGTNWAGCTECHIGADLLLIYRVRSAAPRAGSVLSCFFCWRRRLWRLQERGKRLPVRTHPIAHQPSHGGPRACALSGTAGGGTPRPPGLN